MSRELILAASPGEVRGVLLEDDTPVALMVEREQDGSILGGLFLGRILRVVPSLPGAFIELGRDRAAFMPGHHLPSGAALVEGAAVLVQVVKDGFADKAPEVTAAPSFQGRLAVWTPGKPGIAVSRQLPPAERARLSTLLEPLIRPGEGIVLRSHAAGAPAADLAADITRLRADYLALSAAIAGIKPPARLDPGPAALDRVIEAAGPGLDRVLVEQREIQAATRRLFAKRDPGLAERVLLIDAPHGILAEHGLDDVFDAALRPRVGLSEGAEIIIESVTACTLIDVNLGAVAGGRGKAGEAVRRVNLRAAAEIARQLRLRNIAGAIVVDFISMRSREQRQEVEAAFEAAAAADPVAIELHGWTRLGHFEITRRRTAAPLADIMLVPGSARRIKSPVTVALEALRALDRVPIGPGPLQVTVHPLVALELEGRLAKLLIGVTKRAGRRVLIERDAARDPETFDLRG